MEQKISIVLGVRYETEILFQDEFEQLAKEHKNVTFIPTISRPSKEWKGERGYVQEIIKKYFPNPDGVDIYACGLVKMIEDLQKSLSDSGFPKERIRYEKWT